MAMIIILQKNCVTTAKEKKKTQEVQQHYFESPFHGIGDTEGDRLESEDI